ncbi:tRNA pseudouridine(55) synthase TruB [Fructobacillus sp. M1-13]|uniref:tRNA pseudouridine synthase B n=1 Tax=Fructobacillus papyriferae TaxID=2713171 RepID=A0ABS5QNG6_9LACO|nr:tRNA pseudouridine(55) synthase TruB [Fructobacillus papyriferae]MBS9334611.1 tRNA pseudouridine(55) synthase TruB [Fructobacillus papyriferae]MCD2158601.1 tRNA pseudouridine(55) synthase TruB [Fructobacillus papyriferae]
MEKNGSNLTGLLVVNKPKGMTSFGVVSRLRRITGQKKIGHAGTLDPNVDGVLVVALGRATKLIDLLQRRPKTYVGTVTFGFATETQDADGAVIEKQPLEKPLEDSVVQAACRQLEGDIIQVPPLYSAVKVKGKRLYEYARAGEEVSLPKRAATIYYFHLTAETAFDANKGYQTAFFEAQVSKGTYIRTLAYDLGRSLGLPATMTALRRTSGSGFDLAQATDLDELMAMSREELAAVLKPIAAVLPFERKDMNEEENFAVRNGQKVDTWPKNRDGYYQLYDKDQLVAVYQYSDEEGLWRSRYYFA